MQKVGVSIMSRHPREPVLTCGRCGRRIKPGEQYRKQKAGRALHVTDADGCIRRRQAARA